MGLFVSEELRGKRLAGSLAAIWLKLCFELERTPSTKKMDKPLISLVLQQFDFTPVNLNTEVSISAEWGEKNEIVLWSPDMEKLRSTFSKRYLKTQHMAITSERPAASRTVYVNTSYEAPPWEALSKRVDETLDGKELCLYERPEGGGIRMFLEAQLSQLSSFRISRSAVRGAPHSVVAEDLSDAAELVEQSVDG